MLAFAAVVATLALLVAVNALYVAAEFATVAVRKSRLREMADAGNRLARTLLPVLEDRRRLDDYVAACQLGITASSLALGAYGQGRIAVELAPRLADLGGLAAPVAHSIAAAGVLFALTMLQVVLGELFPKSVAVQYRERVATALVIPMQWSVALFRPFIWLFNGSANVILRLLRVDVGGAHAHVHSPEEIELLVTESQKGGLVASEEQEMLRNAFRFGDLAVRQVMTPRNRMQAEPQDSSLVSLIDRALSTGSSRIPIFRETIDNVIGFVHIKDMFRELVAQRNGAVASERPVDHIMRSVIYVPENLAVIELWRQLRGQHEHMAIVLDEYGGTAGLVTLDDIIEEIFGELRDEFDEQATVITTDREGRLHLRGDLLIADVNEMLDLELPAAAVDTLGGLVMHELGRIPLVGDVVTTGRPLVSVRVEQMAGHAVTEVSLCQADGTPLPLPSRSLQ
jgi:putative hemolysin